MPDDPDLRRLLWYLLGGTRGGENRARIIRELREKPGNLNQIASRLGMDYRLAKHHVEVLAKNSLAISKGERYGQMYFLNPWLESHFDIFEEVAKRLGFDFAPPRI
jgi:DNA-binding transcriptional ArsR family regulator